MKYFLKKEWIYGGSRTTSSQKNVGWNKIGLFDMKTKTSTNKYIIRCRQVYKLTRIIIIRKKIKIQFISTFKIKESLHIPNSKTFINL